MVFPPSFLTLAYRHHDGPLAALPVRAAEGLDGRIQRHIQPQGSDYGEPPAATTAEAEAGWADAQFQQAPGQLLDLAVRKYKCEAHESQDQDVYQHCAMDTILSPNMRHVGRCRRVALRHLYSRCAGDRRIHHEDTGTRASNPIQNDR